MRGRLQSSYSKCGKLVNDKGLEALVDLFLLSRCLLDSAHLSHLLIDDAHLIIQQLDEIMFYLGQPLKVCLALEPTFDLLERAQYSHPEYFKLLLDLLYIRI